jgi:hypothetical protein
VLIPLTPRIENSYAAIKSFDQLFKLFCIFIVPPALVYTDAEGLQLLERQGAVMRGEWTNLLKSEGDAEDID